MCGMTYNQCGRQLLPPLLVAIQTEFSLTNSQGSALMAIFSLAYAVVQLFVGILNQVLGRSSILVFSTAAYAVVLIVTSYVRSYRLMLVLQVAGALTAGAYFVTGLSIMGGLPGDSKRKGFLMGLYLSAMSLGAIISSGVSGLALKYWNWRMAYLIWGLVGIFIGLLMLKYLPKNNQLVDDEGSRAQRPVLSPRIINVTYVLLVISLMLNSIRVWGVNTFLCAFLSEVKGFSQASAAALYGVVRALGVPGQTLTGMMLGSIGRFQTVILTTSLGAFATCLPLADYGRSFFFAFLAFYGFVGPTAFGSIMASIQDSTPPESWDTVTGFANAFSFIGAAVGPVLVGRIVDSSGFNAAFMTLSALTALGCLIACFAWKTGRRHRHGRVESR